MVVVVLAAVAVYARTACLPGVLLDTNLASFWVD